MQMLSYKHCKHSPVEHIKCVFLRYGDNNKSHGMIELASNVFAIESDLLLFR